MITPESKTILKAQNSLRRFLNCVWRVRPNQSPEAWLRPQAAARSTRMVARLRHEVLTKVRASAQAHGH